MKFSAAAGLGRATCLALMLAVAGLAPAHAHPADSTGPSFELSPLQQREALFHTVAWRLASTNAPFCVNTWSLIGLSLGSAKPNDGSLLVVSAAQHSPAERAGLLPGERIESIDGVQPQTLRATGDEAAEQIRTIHRQIETLLEQGGKITLTRVNAAREAAKITIDAQPVCPSRFLPRSGNKIGADGVNVHFGLEFAGFDYPEDEFAAAVAHEFAHNLLGHPYWLDREGRNRRNVRMTEHEADRLMPWLLANAGYDPAAARRFMERWGPEHGGGLLRKRTHDGWDERAELIGGEVALVEQLWIKEGAADWQVHFRREEGLSETGS